MPIKVAQANVQITPRVRPAPPQRAIPNHKGNSTTMILSGASRRGPKRAILGSGGLHGRRHFIFPPYFHRHGLGHLIKSRRKGFPEDPLQFLFSTSRRNEEDQRRRDSPTEREKKLWGMRWEYQERNGVSSERRSEYIQGKGWVDIDSIHPEVENQKSVDSSKQPREEASVYFVTLLALSADLEQV